MQKDKPSVKLRILLVEDDADILKINSIHLTRQGYEVVRADTLKKAFEQVALAPPALIVLDVTLPDGSGVSFCEDIRGKTDAPIIFLTCFDQDEDKVKGLMAGGDDYMTKPYSLSELTARIHALLRRAQLNKVKSILDFPPLRIDTVAQRVYVNERDALLTTKEYQLLLILALSAGKTVETARLYEKAWGLPLADGLKTVQVHISSIRKKLKTDDCGVRIHTVRNLGYCFEYEESH